MLKQIQELRTWLESCNTKQIAAIAYKSKVAERTLWSIRKGKSLPSIPTLEKLLKVKR